MEKFLNSAAPWMAILLQVSADFVHDLELDRSRSRESHSRSGNSGFWSYAYGTRQYAYEMAGTRMGEALRVWEKEMIF